MEDAMAAGASVKPTTQWYQTSGRKIMKDAIKAKFSSANMQKTLTVTGRSVLVESTRNVIWGTGTPFTSNDALNPQTFKGQNLLGTLLMELRTELQDMLSTKPNINKSSTQGAPTASLEPMPGMSGTVNMTLPA